MRTFVFFILVIFFGILQATVFDLLKLFGVKPDLLMVSVVAAALMFDLKRALVLNTLIGLFKDSFASGSIGMQVPLCIIWSLVIWNLALKISLESPSLRIGLVGVIAFLHNILTGLVIVSSGAPVPAGIFIRTVFIGSLYTACLSPLALDCLYALCPPRRRPYRRIEGELW